MRKEEIKNKKLPIITTIVIAIVVLVAYELVMILTGGTNYVLGVILALAVVVGRLIRLMVLKKTD